MKRLISMAFLISALFIYGCGDKTNEADNQQEAKPLVQAPSFNADSAYSFVQQQVDFGPRVPNTPAHSEAADFFVTKFKGYGASVKEQRFETTTFDGTDVSLVNIMAQFNPKATKRILLAAHWDSRPFADKDPENPDKAMLGANDGASGVGVLMEIARLIGRDSLGIGVDILLFDGEDWGEKNNMGYTPTPDDLQTWWCLGSQYWSKHNGNYSAYYGILLDMVGAKGAQFHKEGASRTYASKIVRKVWNTASAIGYSSYFIHQDKPEIVDDHIFVNTIAKIPMIDIVHYDPTHGYFGDYHHTHQDDMELIDKRTLKAVGQTVLTVLYNE